LLTGEVVVQRRSGHAGGGADVVHRDTVVPARGEQPDGDLQDLVAAVTASAPVRVHGHPASLASRQGGQNRLVTDVTMFMVRFASRFGAASSLVAALLVVQHLGWTSKAALVSPEAAAARCAHGSSVQRPPR